MANEAVIDAQDEKFWVGGRQPLGASYGKLMMWFFLLSDALTFSGFLTAYGLMRFKYVESWPVAEDVFTHFPYISGEQPLLYVALMTFILIMSSVTMVLAVNEGHHNNKKGVILWMFLTIVGGFFFLGSQAWEWYHFIIGDKGSVQMENGQMLYVADQEGSHISLTELINGPQTDGHHGGHHEHFTDEQLRAAFAQGDYQLMTTGKKKELFSAQVSDRMIQKAHVVHGANMTRNEYGSPLFANFFFFITGFHGFHVFSGVVINIVVFINVIMGTYAQRGHYEMVEKVGLYWHFVDLVWVFVFTFFYLV
ncbi:MAG: Cytochrome bo(3) ubiquinol oxidase subunit 3 [Flavobacteriia bacterium]|nr:MAG: Cytochrome bo(3) ubiquinol oxidase subunit 3 [Flavobacteriia bacterium]